MKTYPAPWRTDAYLPAASPDGGYVWSVRSDDGDHVLFDCGETVAKQVVGARNASPEGASLVEMRDRYEGILEHHRTETQKVRTHFQRELAQALTALEACRERAGDA